MEVTDSNSTGASRVRRNSFRLLGPRDGLKWAAEVRVGADRVKGKGRTRAVDLHAVTFSPCRDVLLCGKQRSTCSAAFSDALSPNMKMNDHFS